MPEIIIVKLSRLRASSGYSIDLAPFGAPVVKKGKGQPADEKKLRWKLQGKDADRMKIRFSDANFHGLPANLTIESNDKGEVETGDVKGTVSIKRSYKYSISIFLKEGAPVQRIDMDPEYWVRD